MLIKFTRKHNRLPFKKLYQSNNSYFVTICVEGRRYIFDMVYNGKIIRRIALTPGNGDTCTVVNGDTVVASTLVTKLCMESLLNLYEIYENISIGDWVIMPNHIHFIINFLDIPRSKFTCKVADLGTIIKSFKLHFQKRIVEATTVSPLIHTNVTSSLQNYFKHIDINTHKIWQKSFYDHVIRGEKDLQRIQEYVLNNPLQWELDILNPKHNDQYQMWLIAKNTKLKLE